MKTLVDSKSFDFKGALHKPRRMQLLETEREKNPDLDKNWLDENKNICIFRGITMELLVQIYSFSLSRNPQGTHGYLGVDM